MEKKSRKSSILLCDMIGPLIAIENILIIIFYLWWNFAIRTKPGIVSYIILYLMLFINVILVVVSLVSLIRLVSNKVRISKNLKRDKINFSVVGIVLGLILLLFSGVISESVGRFNEPVESCNDVVNDLGGMR